MVSVACDPSGMSYASVGWDCSLHLWNVSDGKWEGEVDSVSPCAINCVDWHPRRSILAIACWDATIKLINVTSKTAEYVFRGHRDSVRAAVFTRPDGLRLVSSSLDGDIRLWSVDKKCALAVVDSVPGVTINQLCLARGNAKGLILLKALLLGKYTCKKIIYQAMMLVTYHFVIEVKFDHSHIVI